MTARNIVIGQKISSAKAQRARELRGNMTEAEKELWSSLRTNQLSGWHFRRQQVIGGFIVDFYCHAASLAVEVDGEIHKSQQEYDKERTALIREYGIEVIRFTNEEIKDHLPRVLQELEARCKVRSALHHVKQEP